MGAVKVCKIVTNEVPGYANVVIYDPSASSGSCVQTPTAQPVPTPLPTDTPTPFVLCQEKILPNEYQGLSMSSSSGVFFVYNVKAHKDMIIDTFYFKFVDTANINVWTKKGNYEGFEEEETAWTQIVDNVSMVTGEIRKDDFTPVKIDEGAEQSFYLQFSESGVYVKNGSNTGDLVAENEDLSMFWGSRTYGKFSWSIKNSYMVHTKIHYRLCKDTPTASPTESKTTPTRSPITPTWSPMKYPSVFPTTSNTRSPTKVCMDDPNFVKGRGGRKRTCKYIGQGKKQWRINKWCNKKKSQVKISEICCETCKKCNCGANCGKAPCKKK